MQLHQATTNEEVVRCDTRGGEWRDDALVIRKPTIRKSYAHKQMEPGSLSNLSECEAGVCARVISEGQREGPGSEGTNKKYGLDDGDIHDGNARQHVGKGMLCYSIH